MAQRVLIVDNSLFMREKLKTLLADAGCEVVAEASTGQEGVERFQECRPDFVTLDIVMPKHNGGLDGAEALKLIRQIDATAKVVMITAVDKQRQIDECMRAGATAYVTKPIDADAIRRVVLEVT